MYLEPKKFAAGNIINLPDDDELSPEFLNIRTLINHEDIEFVKQGLLIWESLFTTDLQEFWVSIPQILGWYSFENKINIDDLICATAHAFTFNVYVKKTIMHRSDQNPEDRIHKSFISAWIMAVLYESEEVQPIIKSYVTGLWAKGWSEVPYNIETLSFIKEVFIISSAISPDFLKDFSGLTRLEFYQNSRLRELPAFLVDFPLKTLSLQSMYIRALPGWLDKLPLEKLVLSRMYQWKKGFPIVIANMPSLKDVTFSYIKINDHLPDLSHLTNLKRFQILNCVIQEPINNNFFPPNAVTVHREY